MFITQISIFVENKPGAMMEITGILRSANVNIRALSLADTTDFGVIRLIVDNREDAVKALREKEMTVIETEVIAISVDDKPGAFHKALETLYEDSIMVEYSYAFVSPVGGGATVILRCREQQEAAKKLKAKGFRLLSQNDIIN